MSPTLTYEAPSLPQGQFVAPPPPGENQRLGLFHTSDELAIWQDRAVNGPYKTTGDESTNSPGDWDRIVTNKNTFHSNPSSGRWTTPNTGGNGCVLATEYSWPEPGTPDSMGWSMRLRDAAFHYLVSGDSDATRLQNMIDELLWVSSQSFTDWGAATPWCFAVFWDVAPSFGICSILTKVLFAYDYLGRDKFSQGELDQLDRWFFDAADFWRRDSDVSLGNLYVNRLAGNYTLTDGAACTYNPESPYIGAPAIADMPAKYYNNRRGSIIRFCGLAGIYLQQAGRTYTDGRTGTLADIITSAQLYVQEYVRFTVFPDGYVGDMARVNDDSTQEVGWAYSSVAIANCLEIADAFARVGDDSLYTYNTALGACNTVGTINDGGSRQGQNRDLLYAAQSYLKYHTDVYARYHGSNDSPTDNNRIDGRYPRDGSSWAGIHDTYFCFANNYWQDSFITQAYTRTHSGAVAYSATPKYAPLPWTGENSIFPAILFMFGQMEGLTDPYTVA